MGIFSQKILSNDRPNITISVASNLSCDSYKEAIEILSSHKSEYVDEMRQLYRKCLLKKELKRMMNSMVNIFGLKAVKKQYLKRKWSK